MIKACENCKKPIIFKGKNHKYCEDCSKEKRKESIRKARKKYLLKQNKICTNCGKPMPSNGGNHKYCNICSEELTKENGRRRRINYYCKWKDLIPSKPGTGWLSSHPRTDFQQEYLVIQREFKRLGLYI